ncbi:adenosylmethionine--8-amino-7-oxononanoate transaminase [Myroides sp. LJL110]
MLESLEQRDLKVNWHPYTQMKTAHGPIAITHGKQAYIYDENDNKYIDAVSSWWVTLHGHAHPYIAQKVYDQLQSIEQVIFAGFTHKPAVELSERLLKLLPKNQEKVFYSDNGSTAIEVGIKMCLQYFYNQNQSKSTIVAFKNAYHGDTFGAMSVSARGIWTDPFLKQLFNVVFIDPPTPTNFKSNKKIIDKHADDIACFIYEPLIQGAAGMQMHQAKDLDLLLSYCKSKSILLIQDEIFVGFGRTGKLFAADHLNTSPDIMCFSKGLTGGTMAMGVTTCSDLIYQAFYSDDKTKALFHGHSFTASPLACSASLASLDLLLSKACQDDIQRISQSHLDFKKIIQTHPKVKNVRCCGTIFAMEWITNEHTSYFSDMHDILYPYFLEKGILMRPLGNIIYLVPPYCITGKDLDYIYKTILKALDKI